MAETQGDKLVEKADSKSSVSLFRWSPDWDAALALYEKAAQKYRQAGCLDKAKHAFEKAALAQEKLGSPWHAAKHLETAALVAKEMKGGAVEIEMFFKRACALYMEAGRSQTGADALCRAGKALEPIDTDAACRMYREALEIYEDEGKQHYSHDAFRTLIQLQIRNRRYGEAAGTLMRFAVACEKNQSKLSQCKSYLGAIVVLLYAQEVSQADAILGDCMVMEGFIGSDECLAASDLLEAYRGGDSENIRKVVADTHTFSHLDTVILQLARKLPQGDVAQLSRTIGGVAPLSATGTTNASTAQGTARDISMDDINENDLC
mmetsp:Transcript_20692/g.39324  ORF Transcript_20692/g.39324 Transcript_20692/m.39324 type:complete len:320 (+) Transcript_20692:17-976(+)